MELFHVSVALSSHKDGLIFWNCVHLYLICILQYVFKTRK
jgi:hypothetical protein